MVALGLVAGVELACAESDNAHNTYDEIVVSAVGFETPKSQIGSALSVINKETIERSQADFVSDVLVNLSGVTFDQEGGMGGVGHLRLRGLDRQYIAVLVDGVAMGDPSDPQGSAELANLQTSGIDRIEVLRGSQSILYGSNSVAGAIQVFTRKGVGPLAGQVLLETGSRSTRRLGATSQFGAQNFSMRVSLDQITSKPESEFDKHGSQYNEDEDYEHFAVSGRFDFVLGEDTDLTVTSRGGQASTEYDGYDPISYAPIDGWFGVDTDLWAVNARLTHQAMGDKVKIDVEGGRFERRRDSFQEIGPDYWNDGGRDTIGARATLQASSDITLLLGFEQKDERFAQAGLSEKKSDTRSYYGVGQATITPKLHVSLAWRSDTHSLFGNHNSWRNAIAYQAYDWLKLYASQGTGFRAPSLYELYGEDPLYCVNGVCGNLSLLPETSRSSDVGAEMSLLSGRMRLELTAFRIDLNDRILFDDIGPPTYLGNYQNDPGRARSEGLEVNVDFSVTDSLNISANMTFTDPQKADGSIANKQPRQILNVSADYEFGEGRGLLSASWRHVGHRYVSSVRQEDYGLLSLRSQWQLQEGVRFYAGIENALDDHYQTSTGKSTPGRHFKIGLRVGF